MLVDESFTLCNAFQGRTLVALQNFGRIHGTRSVFFGDSALRQPNQGLLGTLNNPKSLAPLIISHKKCQIPS